MSKQAIERKFVDWISQRFFHHPASEDMLIFLDNFRFFFLTAVITGPLLFLVNIISGRVLGRAEYGTYQLVLSVSSLLGIMMAFGINVSALRHVALAVKEGEENKVKELTSSALFLNYLYAFIVILITWVFRGSIKDYLHISDSLLWLGVLVALINSNWLVIKNILLSINLRREAKLEVLLAAAYLGGLLVFLSFSKTAFSPLFGYVFAYGLCIISAVYFLRKYLTTKLLGFKPLLKYAIYGYLAGLVALSDLFFTGIDKMVIGHYLSVSEVGLYSAYYAASVFFTASIWQVLSSVLAPTVNKAEDKEAILRKINRSSFLLFFPLLVFNFGVLFVVYKLFGSAYPFNLFTGSLFALNASIYIIIQTHNLVLGSEGMEGIKYSAILSIILAGAVLIGMVIIAPYLGINGILYVRLGMLSLMLLLLYLKNRNLFYRN